MKLNMSGDDMVREMHKKYAQGLSDNEIKNYWMSIQPENLNESEIYIPTNTHLQNLREDFNRALSSNSIRNAESIQDWFKLQSYLPQPSLGLIHKFLWAAKEEPEQCKKIMTRFYSLRGTDDELFGNRDPCSLEARQVYESSNFTCLPGYTKEMYRVTVSALSTPDADQFIPKEWIKRLFYLTDIRIRDDFCLGEVIVFDLKGFSFQHLVKFPIALSKKLVVATEGALPTRIKQIHLINCPNFVDKIVALFRPFLKDKIAKRIHIHMGGYEDLYKYIPQEILPNEYGGKAGSIKNLNNHWIQKLEKNRDWFLTEEKLIKRLYFEAKREGKMFADSGELFGMEGTFKKLAID